MSSSSSSIFGGRISGRVEGKTGNKGKVGGVFGLLPGPGIVCFWWLVI